LRSAQRRQRVVLGENIRGQLGNGSTDAVLVPVAPRL
jgi:hypothetical protein